MTRAAARVLGATLGGLIAVGFPVAAWTLNAAAAAARSLEAPATRTPAGQTPPPKILLDQPVRAVEYQLDRLTNDEIVRVERKPDDVRYRPVYMALLTRKGLSREVRVEVLSALTKMDKVSETRVLLDALAKVKPEDTQVADTLVGMLVGQPADALRVERGTLMNATAANSAPYVLRGAYAGLMVADGNPSQAWQTATSHEGHLLELLRGVPSLGKAEQLRAQLATQISDLIPRTTDAPTRSAALTALASTRRDAATFRTLANEVSAGADTESRGAAIRALAFIPENVWPRSDLEPLARSLVAFVKATETDKRTESPAVDAMQLGERIAAALPTETGRGIRRDLRALGVQVVRIETVIEQIKFDLNWFAVEAGKPVQILLSNPDAMPHNLLIGKPGSLQEIGLAAATVPMPSDPAVKPFVPDTPLVLQSTRLVQQGETEHLAFTAPKEPGEYVYLCSFPGHWLRMYGVMIVVDSLDAWEVKRTPPTDPTTKQPFASQRN